MDSLKLELGFSTFLKHLTFRKVTRWLLECWSTNSAPSGTGLGRKKGEKDTWDFSQLGDLPVSNTSFKKDWECLKMMLAIKRSKEGRDCRTTVQSVRNSGLPIA